MGNLLGAPVTIKETDSGTTANGIPYAVSSMQGWRVSMEDAHIMEPNLYVNNMDTCQQESLPDHALFAVFDGHGGASAALYAGRNFLRVLSRQPAFCAYAQWYLHEKEQRKPFKSPKNKEAYMTSGLNLLKEALQTAFLEMDKEIALALRGDKVVDADEPYHPDTAAAATAAATTADGTTTDAAAHNNNNRMMKEEEAGGDSGTTACVVLLTPDWIICANAGDSRAVLSRKTLRAVALSEDHKPDDDVEEKRVRAAGGFVAGGRVEGDLAVSRGFGDFRFKNIPVVLSATSTGIASSVVEEQEEPTMKPGEQKISPIPDFVTVDRDDTQDEFMVVACDGIWDVLTNEELVSAVGKLFQEGESNLGLICEEVRYCLRRYLLRSLLTSM